MEYCTDARLYGNNFGEGAMCVLLLETSLRPSPIFNHMELVKKYSVTEPGSPKDVEQVS